MHLVSCQDRRDKITFSQKTSAEYHSNRTKEAPFPSASASRGSHVFRGIGRSRMAETALKFGPEWLRNLSQGTTNPNVSSPPPSPGITKYKLADFRYGREDMLAMFNRNGIPPPDLKQFSLLVEDMVQVPMSVTPLSEEEQRSCSRSVNSDAVLRLMGPSSSVTGSGPKSMRGSSVDRGRGRGRCGFFTRGQPNDDGSEQPGGFSRPRAFERSQSLQERGQPWDERRSEKPFAGKDGEPGSFIRRDSGRGNTDSWRSVHRDRDRDRVNEEEPSWRGNTSRNSWNGNDKERGGEFGRDRENGPVADKNRGNVRKSHGYERNWGDDNDGGGDYYLPEWSTEDNRSAERVGTFDATGAFMESHDDDKPKLVRKRETNKSNHHGPLPKLKEVEDDAVIENGPVVPDNPPVEEPVAPKPDQAPSRTALTPPAPQQVPTTVTAPKPSPSPTPKDVASVETAVETKDSQVPNLNSFPKATAPPDEDKGPDAPLNRVRHTQPPPGTSAADKLPEAYELEKNEDGTFEDIQKAAEILLAKWTAEEDEELAPRQHQVHMAVAAHTDHWFYRDPQGQIQGPFSVGEMGEWFRAGYFSMSLWVRRGCDDRFHQLGELVKRGLVPFLPEVPASVPAAPPNLLNGLLMPNVSQHGSSVGPELDTERQLRMLQSQFLQQQQLIQHQLQQQQQLFIRQQQILGNLKQQDGFGLLTAQQQQQLLLQQLLAQQLNVHHHLVNSGAPTLQEMGSFEHVPQVPGMAFKNEGNQQNSWSAPPTGGWGSQMPVTALNVWDLEAQTTINVDHGRSEQVSAQQLKQDAHKEESQQRILLRIAAIQEEKRRREVAAMAEEEHRRQQEMEEKRKKEEEDMVRIRLALEEEARERMLAEEEERRQEEERRKEEERRSEEERRKEEERRRKEEEKKRKEEEKSRKEEEKLRKEAEKARKEELRKQKEAEEKQRKEEQKRKEKEKQRQEEENKRKEKQRQEEERRIKDEERKMKEEERKRQEMEKRLQEEREKEDEEAKRTIAAQQEVINNKMRDKQLMAKAWGGQNPGPPSTTSSLVEIQRLQEEKEKQRDRQLQQQQLLLAQLQLQEQQRQQQQEALKQRKEAATFSWANKSNLNNNPVKSLLEIQQEEAEKVMKQQQKMQQQQIQLQQQQQQLLQAEQQKKQAAIPWSLASAGVWSNASAHLMRNAAPAPTPTPTRPSEPPSQGLGFWEDSVATTKKTLATQQAVSHSANHAVPKSQVQLAKPKVVRMEEVSNAKADMTDEFTQWCLQALSKMQATLDVPTFVMFLKDVEAPYEVNDYIRSYLGEGKEAREFGKLFLQKRSKYRNQSRKQEEENMWGPAPAITPALCKPVPQEVDSSKAGGGKKKKKSKMQKVDSSILGFTVHAAMDRINVGEIDKVDGM